MLGSHTLSRLRAGSDMDRFIFQESRSTFFDRMACHTCKVTMALWSPSE